MIVNGRLHEATFRQSPNVGGRLKKPKFVVIHYTAGKNAASSVNWLCSKMAKASAHLVIGRGGEIYQLAPFDQVTWHAGRSEWSGYSGLNSYSIGIELDNPGFVSRDASGKFRSLHLGTTYANEDVVVDDKGRGWVTYTPAQIRLVEQICLELRETYPSLVDMVGHSDIAPGRKQDPGFAWPMESVRSVVFGRG